MFFAFERVGQYVENNVVNYIMKAIKAVILTLMMASLNRSR